MIAVNKHACPQNHPCPAVGSCPVGALIQDDIFAAPRIDRDICTRVWRLYGGLPRVLAGAGRGRGSLIVHIELVCQECHHAFALVTPLAIKLQQKRCPKCGSEQVRQTFASYLRNGTRSDPECGVPGCTTYG